jgi:arsenate reductase
MVKTNVLFLCTGNSARSQMAEAFLRAYAGDRFNAYSAGLTARGIHPLTIEVMREVGLDIGAQRSKDLNEYMGQMHFGFLITVCARAEEQCPRTFPGLGQRLHWDIPDPAAFEGPPEEMRSRFRQARDLVDRHIRGWLAEQGVEVNP